MADSVQVLVKIDDSELRNQLEKIQQTGKEFGKNNSALQQLADMLKNIRTGIKGSLAAGAISGADTKAGLDKTSWKPFMESVQEFTESIENFITEFAKSIKSFTIAVNNFKRHMEDFGKLFAPEEQDDLHLDAENLLQAEKTGKPAPEAKGFAKIAEILTDLGEKFKIANKGMAETMMANPKFLGIAVGVAAIAALIVKSSAVLQNTFKLISASVMLIFRPIGDFIGMLLRPFIVRFLHTMIPIMIPLMEWARTEGFLLGEKILAGIDYILAGTFLADIRQALMDAWNSTAEWVVEVGEAIQGWFDENIINPLKEAWDATVAFFTDAWEATEEALRGAWDAIVVFFTDAWNATVEALTAAWEAIVTFFTDAWAATEETLREAWSATVAWFQGVAETIGGALTEAWTAITEWASWVGSSVISGLTEAWSKITEWALMVKDHYIEGLFATWEAISQWAEWVSSSIMPILMSAWSGIVGWALDMQDKVMVIIKGAWEGITSISQSIFDALQAAYNSVMGFLHTVTGGLIGHNSEVEQVQTDNVAVGVPEGELESFVDIQDATGEMADIMEQVTDKDVKKVDQLWSNIGVTMQDVTERIKSKDKQNWDDISDTTVTIASTLQAAYEKAKAMLARARSAQSRGKSGGGGDTLDTILKKGGYVADHMAEGGMINEHIFGIGKSGKFYEFGERGSEAVIPQGKMGSVAKTVNFNPTINLTITGAANMDADMMVSKLKEMLKKEIYDELMEQTQNVGVV